MVRRTVLALAALAAIAACSTESIPVAPVPSPGAAFKGTLPDKAPPTSPQSTVGRRPSLAGSKPAATKAEDASAQQYVNQLLAAIEPHYHYPAAFREKHLAGLVVYRMTLGRSGEILALELVKSSGNEAIDQFARETILLAIPLPPVPETVRRPQLTVEATIRVGPSESKAPGT